MSWAERLQPASYTSPSGKTISFIFEDVEKAGVRRTVAYEFPGVAGAFIQDMGSGARRFPVRAIFSGPECDLDAYEFEAAVFEPGIGRLSHPRYGVANVLPTGDVKREDPLKVGANQVIVLVTFLESLVDLFPEANPGATSVITSRSAFAESAADDFASTDLESATGRAGFKSTFEGLLGSADSALESVAEFNATAERTYSDIRDSIDRGIDSLIATPLTLAFQTIELIRAPARAISLIWDRLDGYAGLISSLTSEGSVRGAREARATDLFVTASVAAAAESAILATYASKPEALSAAVRVVDMLAEAVAWRDETFAAVELDDTGETYSALRGTVLSSVAELYEAAFTLRSVRRIFTDRPVTIIELAAAFYGEIDANLDEFIALNRFTGSELLGVPAGREVVHYA